MFSKILLKTKEPLLANDGRGMKYYVGSVQGMSHILFANSPTDLLLPIEQGSASNTYVHMYILTFKHTTRQI